MNKIKNKRDLGKNINRYRRSGNLQKAIEYCQFELANDPTNPELHVKLGDLYLEWHLDIHQARQYIDEAITEYQRALEAYIDAAEIYYKIGMAFYYKNEIDRAINYFNLALEKNENLADGYYMLAVCHTKKAHFQDALEYAQKAISKNKFKSSRAHFLIYNLIRIMSVKNFKRTLRKYYEFWMSVFTLPFDKDAIKNVMKMLSYFAFFPVLVKGWYMVATKGVTEAIDIYKAALEKAPGFILLYCLLGDIYRVIGRFEDAILEYKMAIMFDSLNITAYRSLCGVYEELGDFDSAIETYRILIEIQPHAAELYSNLGNILYLKGEIKEAISCYQNAITLNPAPAWTSVIAQTLGYVLQEGEKNVDAAISAYQSAYLLTPTDIDIFVNLGSAFYDKQEYNNALTVYRRALEIDPANAKIHCNLGFLHWGKGDIAEAMKEYELAIKYDSTYDIAYNNLGVIYLDDLGRVQPAIDLFRKAIEYNPNYALAHYNLARSIAITGDKIEAAKLYQVAMDLNNVTNELDPQEINEKIQNLFD